MAGEVSPRVERHVSTQASVANAAAARCGTLSARAAWCAPGKCRWPTSPALRQETPPDLEIEAFAHGAMCMAVSGRCLISSYLTGRSGNKGHCTQPCRWSYQLEEEKRPGEFFPIEEDDRGTFIMNAKDLNMLAHLQALADAGVDSIKIEGRNKKAFYVATVVGAYRRALDGEPPEVVADELLAVSTVPTALASISPRLNRRPPTMATSRRPCTWPTSSHPPRVIQSEACSAKSKDFPR